MRDAIRDVREQLEKVEQTLHWAGDIGDTAAALVNLGPKVAALGTALRGFPWPGGQ